MFPKRPVSEFSSDEIVVNSEGGKQSAVPVRLDLADPYAMLALGRVLATGVHYGVDNWRLIPAREHVNHAMAHIMGWLANDTSDPHLDHAFCRLMMAIATDEGNHSAAEASPGIGPCPTLRRD